MFSWLFGRNKKTESEEAPVLESAAESETQALEEAWYDHKSVIMEAKLGPSYGTVMHAIVPFSIGGSLDLYYYAKSKFGGTAIATQELSLLADQGSSNDAYNTYEFAMFTRHSIDLDSVEAGETDFAKAHQNISAILNPISNYSSQAKLNPNETMEFPDSFEGIGGKCLLLCNFEPEVWPTDKTDANEFGLMLLMEVHRSEMEYAREHGGAKMIEKLKSAGIYPYSDMDRQPVV